MKAQKTHNEKEINFELPENLKECIERYIDYLNEDITGKYLSEDCYQTEILVELNWCKRDHILNIEDITMLKQYYVYGGIHKELLEEKEYMYDR